MEEDYSLAYQMRLENLDRWVELMQELYPKFNEKEKAVYNLGLGLGQNLAFSVWFAEDLKDKSARQIQFMQWANVQEKDIVPQFDEVQRLFSKKEK
jgi:hypothetical protein